MVEERKAVDAKRFLIVGDTPGLEQHYEASEGEAKATATRLAKENDQAYCVYQLIGSASPVQSVEWKGASR